MPEATGGTAPRVAGAPGNEIAVHTNGRHRAGHRDALGARWRRDRAGRHRRAQRRTIRRIIQGGGSLDCVGRRGSPIGPASLWDQSTRARARLRRRSLQAQCVVGGAAKSTATRTPRLTNTEKPRQAKPVLMRSNRALRVSCVDKADPCSITKPMRCSVRHSTSSLSVASAAMRSTRSRGPPRRHWSCPRTAVVQKERSKQLEELPLTLVEILSRDHGATPLGSRQPSASSTRRSSVAHRSTRGDV